MQTLQLPSYWLPRPPFALDDETRAAFNALLDEAIACGPDAPIPYTLDAPKWQFLYYIVEERGLLLHGSGNPHIAEFEPRQPQDVTAFGAQNAVYAAADGIWPLYFALLDRERYPTSLVNGCIRVAFPDGTWSEPYYHFSVGHHVRDKYPWREGTIYLLPRETFISEPPIPFGELSIYTTQLASLEPVTPLAKLTVTPEDFPFLERVLAHDDARLEDYAAAIRSGAPWPDEEAS